MCAVNGRTYKSDPVIMAWDLMNEPRCTGCAAAVQTWIATMAAFLKSIDPNHMVRSESKRVHPGLRWAGTCLQFLSSSSNHSSEWSIQPQACCVPSSCGLRTPEP